VLVRARFDDLDNRIGGPVRQEDRHDVSRAARGRRRNDAFIAEMLRRFADRPRDCRIVSHEILELNTKTSTNLRLAQVHNAAQLCPDRDEVPRSDGFGSQPSKCELAIELGIHRRDIAGGVERCEAFRWIPTPTRSARPVAAESPVGRRVVTIDNAVESRALETVERFDEPAEFRLGYAKTPSPRPSMSARTRLCSPDLTRSTGRS
jgi:hypothetical protein